MTASWDYWDDFKLHDAACLIAGVPAIQKRVSKLGEIAEEIPADARPVYRRLWLAVAMGQKYQAGEEDHAGFPKEQALVVRASVDEDGPFLVSRAELHRWVLAVGCKSSYEFLPSLGANERGHEPKVQAKPLPRFAAQEVAILDALRTAGHDPLRLQRNAPGKPGVKAKIHAELVGVNELFMSSSIFGKAWDRLRDGREIVDKA